MHHPLKTEWAARSANRDGPTIAVNQNSESKRYSRQSDRASPHPEWRSAGSATFSWLRAIQRAIANEARSGMPGRRSLTTLDLAVAVSLTGWFNRNLSCFRAAAAVAEDCGVTENAARSSLARLRAAGFLSAIDGERFGGRRGGRPANTYRAVMPEGHHGRPDPEHREVSPSQGAETPICDREVSATCDVGVSPTHVGAIRGTALMDERGSPLPPEAVSDRGEQPPTSAPPARSDGLDAFANAYPATPDTPTAEAVAADPRVRRAWSRAIRSGADPQAIIAGAQRFAGMVAAEGREPRFITRPQNFLLGGAWQAEHRPDPARCTWQADLAMQNPATRAAVASMVGAQSRDRLRAAEARFLAGRRAA